MSQHGPAQIEEIYALWREGNIDALFEHMAEDIVFDQRASREDTIYSGACHGKDEIMQRFGQIRQNWEVLDYNPIEIIGEGDRIAARIAMVYKHRRNGQTLETEAAHFWTFKHGKAVELVEFYDTSLVARLEPVHDVIN